MKNILRRVNPDKPGTSLLSEAAEIIRKGGVVAFPTDTFYGLAVNPFDAVAVARLFTIKKRSPSKPILLLIANMGMLDLLVEPPGAMAQHVMQQFWPGPLTMILKAKKCLSDTLTAGTGKIGVRFPDAVLPIRLMREVNLPLTATSANLSGRPSSTTAQEVQRELIEGLSLILDGGRCQTIPSTLLDMTVAKPSILRSGTVPTDRLKQFLQDHA